MSTTELADELLKIGVDELAAKLPDEQRLSVAKALIAAAYALCPKDHGDKYPDPSAVELASFMLPKGAARHGGRHSESGATAFTDSND